MAKIISWVCLSFMLNIYLVPAIAIAGDFVGMQYHVDRNTNPADIGTTILRNPTLTEAFKLALEYFGVSPEITNVGVAIAQHSFLSGGGDDVTQHHNAPAGYALCSAWAGVKSITGGARFSFIFDPAGNIAIASRTPAKDSFDGRQWIEADVKVLWVKSEKLIKYRNRGACFKSTVAVPNERYHCGDVGNCKEYHLGRAFPITAGINAIVKE